MHNNDSSYIRLEAINCNGANDNSSNNNRRSNLSNKRRNRWRRES